MNKKLQSSKIRLGFVPLTDCAPIVMAQELGLFQKFGLRVTLERELGWATVRDKIAHGELDASHALAAMPIAATFGLGLNPVACECLTALVLSLHGNGITVSRELAQRGVKDGHTLREEIKKKARERVFTFGVVAPFSSHRHLLRKWFSQHGIDPERDVRIVVVPPPQMVANLKAGNVDGFCVGEPWNSVAEAVRAGVCLATSEQLDPQHPEKVLMVRRDFAERRAEEHIALVAALLEACEWCAAPENHELLITTLARPEFVGVAAAGLRRGVMELCVFSGHNTNEPSGDKAAWALELVRTSGLCPASVQLNFALGRKTFRQDIFEQAVRLRATNPTLNETKNENEPVLV